LTLPVCRWCLLALVEGLAVALVLVVVVVDDPQDLDEAEGGSQATQARLLGRGQARPWGRSATAAGARRVGPQVQVDPAALELELIVILGRGARQCPEQWCFFKDGVCDVAGRCPRRSPARLANRYR
jgi:hypothetical protein